jgi:hypothetical protein
MILVSSSCFSPKMLFESALIVFLSLMPNSSRQSGRKAALVALQTIREMEPTNVAVTKALNPASNISRFGITVNVAGPVL